MDIVLLKSGHVITINEECLCIYENVSALLEDKGTEAIDCTCFQNFSNWSPVASDIPAVGFIKCLDKYAELDIVELLSGQTVFIFEDRYTVCTNCLVTPIR